MCQSKKWLWFSLFPLPHTLLILRCLLSAMLASLPSLLLLLHALLYKLSVINQIHTPSTAQHFPKKESTVPHIYCGFSQLFFCSTPTNIQTYFLLSVNACVLVVCCICPKYKAHKSLLSIKNLNIHADFSQFKMQE